VGHVFGEHLLRGVDQDVGVLRREGEVQIESGERVLEFADRLATPVAPGDAERTVAFAGMGFWALISRIAASCCFDIFVLL